MSASTGIVAAGHETTAEAGVRALRAGGNAVDAALAALLTSWVCEPLLTGPGAGGYLLVAGAGEPPTLLDFFVSAPGEGHGGSGPAFLEPVGEPRVERRGIDGPRQRRRGLAVDEYDVPEFLPRR